MKIFNNKTEEWIASEFHNFDSETRKLFITQRNLLRGFRIAFALCVIFVVLTFVNCQISKEYKNREETDILLDKKNFYNHKKAEAVEKCFHFCNDHNIALSERLSCSDKCLLRVRSIYPEPSE